MILREKVKNWLIQNTKYDKNKHKVYALFLGQYEKVLKEELQERKD